MKKVLVLAYDFPPYVSVGGLRPYNWFKYLKEFGVEPIVITRQWSNAYGNELDFIAPSGEKNTIVEHSETGIIYRAPYFPNLSNRLLLKYGEKRFKLLRKAITAYYEFAQFFYVTGPKKELYKTAKKYLKDNKVDVIIATGDPFVLFSFAARLSKQFDTPWVADYRDLWSQPSRTSSDVFQKRFKRIFERKTLQNVYQITTVSEFLKDIIKKSGIIQKINILPNGYDQKLIANTSEIKQRSEYLNIAFMGTVYEWHPWKSFISNLCHFIETHPESKIRMNFYGVNERDTIETFINDNYPLLIDSFSLTPRIPNSEVLRKLAESNVMLLFNDYSYMGTKIFDYLGVKRKILLCYSEDEEAQALKAKHYGIEEIEGISKTLQADLIKETKSGVVVKNGEHLQQVLCDLWEEFSLTRKIECNSIGVERFSRKDQTKKLAEIIKEISNT